MGWYFTQIYMNFRLFFINLIQSLYQTTKCAYTSQSDFLSELFDKFYLITLVGIKSNNLIFFVVLEFKNYLHRV